MAMIHSHALLRYHATSEPLACAHFFSSVNIHRSEGDIRKRPEITTRPAARRQ